ncbi:putative cobalt transporter CbtA [Thermocatellispora tengchongensis]|uniref:Putative cobalt transporter CbtA n=1 Tax=Thermocatellispora tengchongensis TaxID=1073253 RepID=A0A840PF17_9ACTN|nr:CbtA family protein [Thermocatellispora tengchongensis]MBB5136431.1 putative cobalt transporter CbtA [Thermocatellispora tengchongensis]
MIRALLVRGLLAGLAAGLIAACFAYAVGEPRVEAAIALEEAAHAAQDQAQSEAPAHSHSHDEAVVSRDGQRAGLFLALGLYGAAVGGVFALAFAALRGRIGPRPAGTLAAVMAAAAFVAVVLVPFVKYPANPPAVGDPETIGSRTVLYLVMVAIGLLSLAVAVTCARRVPRYPVAAGALGFLLPVAVAWLVLPEVEEVPSGFPATLLWDFRLASLATQLVLWAALGAFFRLAVSPRRPRTAVAG